MTLATIPQPQATPSRMSSREVAELTGKRHDNVLRDIRDMIDTLHSSKVSLAICEAHYQSVPCGKKYPEYIVSHEIGALLLEKYRGLARVPHRLQEEACLKTIEQLLGIMLIRQFPILSYRIDGYDATNKVAYEIDEPGGHASTTQLRHDSKRQDEIRAVLGCTFKRITL